MRVSDFTTTVWLWVQENMESLNDELNLCVNEFQVRKVLIDNIRKDNTLDTFVVNSANWFWITGMIIFKKNCK